MTEKCFNICIHMCMCECPISLGLCIISLDICLVFGLYY